MSDFRAKRQHWRSNAIHALTLTAIAVVLSLTPAAHELNRRISDSYFRLQPRGSESPVVVVSIDDASLQKFGRWPWPRDVLAKLVEAIAKQNPKVIGIDILLSEPQSPAQDESLRSALRSSAPVVLVDKVTIFPDGPRWVEPTPEFANTVAAVGHAQAVLDDDGICRSFPPEELSLAGPRYAFALEVASRVSRGKVDTFLSAYDMRIAKDAGHVVVAKPLLLPIAFRKESIPTVSAATLLDEGGTQSLHNKVVLVGFGAVEIGDRITTPVSHNLPTPGVEIHAHIVDSILMDRALRTMSLPIALLILFSISYAASVLFRFWRGWETVLVVLAAGGAVYSLGFIAFHYVSVIVPVGTWTIAIGLAPLMIYGVELANIEANVTAQMRQLQNWLAYRKGAESAPEEDIPWKIRVLTELQQEMGLRFELYRALLEATRDLVAVFDAEGKLLFANHAFNRSWNATFQPQTLAEVREQITESKEAPIINAGAISEGEATLESKLYSVRLAPLPTTSLTPNGGTLLNMTSLHLRVERDRAREEALGFVTHELRTPLLAIQGFAELMTRMPGAKASAQAPETILRESRRLLALINSYLDVLRTDAGARPLRLANISVRRMILEVLELLMPLAQASGIGLKTVCGDHIFVAADEPLLSGAVLNLVSNAIKYSPRDTEVCVSAENLEGKLRISVHNDGDPISDTESVFNAFVRGSKDEDRQSGWGLGLSLVKRIVEKHDGSITVSSNAMTGTTFTLTIPGASAAMEVSTP